MFNFDWVIKVWRDHIDLSYLKILFIGVGLLFLNAFFVFLTRYIIRKSMEEYGWLNSKPQRVKSTITLIPIYKLSPRKGYYMIHCLLLNIINLLSIPASVIGFIASIITHADGWALVLLGLSSFSVFILVIILDYIPSIIFLPSERKRHSLIEKKHRK